MILSCGIVPVFLNHEEPVFLFLKYRNYWDFPKGRANIAEDPDTAAIREFREETGIQDLKINDITFFTETLPYTTKNGNKKVKKVARYYLAKTDTLKVKLEPNPETGIIEHDEFIWLTYEEAIKFLPLVDRIRKVLDWANENIHGV